MGAVALDWKESARQRRREQADSIPLGWRFENIALSSQYDDAVALINTCGILSASELTITRTTNASELLSRLSSRTWTSEAVITAFCKRAAVVQQLTGCCTEMMFGSAIQRAKELDVYLSKTGTLAGPLHGIPVSLKDNHEVAGVDTTVGWVGLIGKPATKDAVAVSQLRALGAVIYCKTNIPQSLMMSDSYNHVFGQSVNSLNRNLISGGSSGGEGALLGANGSIIGIGTDIGGSIRIPAALQGLWGLCPTIGRIPNRESGRAQKHVVPPVAGPMTTSLESMEYFMKAYLSSEPWKSDPQLLPIPWRENLLASKQKVLKIGYVLYDGVVQCQPPVQRVMRDMISDLKAAGHQLFEWDSTSHRMAYYDLWMKAVLADGGQRCADLCKIVDEPLIEGMLVGKSKDFLSVTQRQDLAEEIWEYQQSYLARWRDCGVDCILMPVTPYVGMRPKQWVQSQQYCGYTAVWNLLNYTALAIPAGRANRKLDQPDDAWTKYVGNGFSDQYNHDQYDSDLVDGMPVGLQIVTGRFGEEKAVAIGRIIENIRRSTSRPQ